jgi:hypothetical protein
MSRYDAREPPRFRLPLGRDVAARRDGRESRRRDTSLGTLQPIGPDLASTEKAGEHLPNVVISPFAAPTRPLEIADAQIPAAPSHQ